MARGGFAFSGSCGVGVSLELAKVQSTEASNAIEGIVTTSTNAFSSWWQIKQLLEIAMSRSIGYRDVEYHPPVVMISHSGVTKSYFAVT